MSMSSSSESSSGQYNDRTVFDEGIKKSRFELGRQLAIEQFRNRPASESGWDRLREMYKFNNGLLTPELELVVSGFKMSCVIGFMGGFANQWQPGREVFKRLYNVSKFLDKDDYMRKALRFQTVFAGRAGFRLAWRLGLFTGLYTLSTISSAVYLNHLGLKEFIISGLITGAIYQSRVGFPGAIVGGILGSCLGVVGGLATNQILKMNEMDFPTLRYEIHSSRLAEWEEKQMLDAKYLADEMIKSAQKSIQEERKATTTSSTSISSN